jgi:hypothetical protein
MLSEQSLQQVSEAMDHQQAIKTHAAERYLLDELSPQERDGFEEHYFSCVQCADEVRSVFTFADNAKAVLAEQPYRVIKPVVAEPRRSAFDWRSWFKPAFAVPVMATLLLFVSGYQTFFVIPRLQREIDTVTAPRAIPSTVARLATRGEDPVISVSTNDQFIQVILDINTPLPVSSYACEVYDDSGALRFTVPATAPSGGSLNLLLPAAGLKPGRYTVKVKTNTTTDDYRFVVQRK